jgi:hypothetical protein
MSATLDPLCGSDITVIKLSASYLPDIALPGLEKQA